MTHDEAFLADIVAHLQDDAPRLIFADWLEEHDRPERAEFIRVQIELAAKYAGWSGEPAADSLLTGGRYAALRRRERILLGMPLEGTDLPQPRPEWAGILRQFLPWHTGSWAFRRGFVEEVTLPFPDWLAHGRALRQAAPLRVVRLTGSVSGLPTPGEAMLRRLSQDDEPGDNPVCGLDLLDLSRLDIERWQLFRAMDEAYRPWRGLRRLILPRWADLEEHCRPREIEHWRTRVPSLVEVRFGSPEK